jgi:hypothetical protein
MYYRIADLGDFTMENQFTRARGTRLPANLKPLKPLSVQLDPVTIDKLTVIANERGIKRAALLREILECSAA